MNAQSPHKWSTLESAVFGLSSALLLLVGVEDWCESRLVRLICCQIISTGNSPGSLLIRSSLDIRLSLTIRLLDLPPLPSARSGISC